MMMMMMLMMMHYSPGWVDSRNFKLTMKHGPRCGTIELRLFDLVRFGPCVAITSAPLSNFYRRQLGLEVSPRGFHITSSSFDVLAKIPPLLFDHRRHALQLFV
jgi:hypothetical protein